MFPSFYQIDIFCYGLCVVPLDCRHFREGAETLPYEYIFKMVQNRRGHSQMSRHRPYKLWFGGGVQIFDLVNDTPATTLQIFDLVRVDCVCSHSFEIALCLAYSNCL